MRYEVKLHILDLDEEQMEDLENFLDDNSIVPTVLEVKEVQ